mmetsp:Transcript_3057/g.7495  ORF Transcript_3057/g.7495 Transcript_3057/m.7495 type:complete len:928 (+) Transcript_3057:85-2868(+)
MPSEALAGLAHALGDDERLELIRTLLEQTHEGLGRQEYAGGWAVFNDPEYNAAECTAFFTIPGTALAGKTMLAALYGICIAYIFIGIIIMADTFMGAIEVIVAKKFHRTKKLADGTVVPYTVRMINPTVANVSLMALGTSLPECVLAVIGVLSTLHSPPDELGPSTIVGTAAYNTCIITALCIGAVPVGVFKKIEKVGVYVMTCIWSLGAYMWMYIVLSVISPNVIEVWEAVITLLFFGVFLLFAYATDVKWRWCRTDLTEADFAEEEPPSHGHGKPKPNKKVEPFKAIDVGPSLVLVDPQRSPALRAIESADLMEQLARAKGAKASMSLEGDLDEARFGRDVPFAGGLGALMGGPRIETFEGGALPPVRTMRARDGSMDAAGMRSRNGSNANTKMRSRNASMLEEARTRPVEMRPRAASNASMLVGLHAETGTADMVVVEFGQARYDMAHGTTLATAVVCRSGVLEQHVTVRWVVRAGGEALGVKPLSGEVLIPAGEVSALVQVQIEGGVVEHSRAFGLALIDVTTQGTFPAQLGGNARTMVDMVGAEDGVRGTNKGVAKFSTHTAFCSWAVDKLRLVVERPEGCDGTLVASVSTVDADASAAAGDFVALREVPVVFGPFETWKVVEVCVLNSPSTTKPEKSFLLELHTVNNAGVSLKMSVCAITVVDDATFKAKLARRIARLRREMRKALEGKGDWMDRFRDALQLHGGIDEDTGEEFEPTVADMIAHFATVFWKVQLALVPPKEWGNGLPAFVGSMMVIIVWTVIMFYMAKIFGCAAGLSQAAIGFAFLSGGTSLPDTFASRIATLHSDRADEAIGNINGSNAVNVFLGLGLPWVLGSVYHNYFPGGNGIYIVPAGHISFAVIMFAVLDVMCVVILLVRRKMLGGELGGPAWAARITMVFLVLAWLAFVVLAIVNEQEDLMPAR